MKPRKATMQRLKIEKSTQRFLVFIYSLCFCRFPGWSIVIAGLLFMNSTGVFKDFISFYCDSFPGVIYVNHFYFCAAVSQPFKLGFYKTETTFKTIISFIVHGLHD